MKLNIIALLFFASLFSTQTLSAQAPPEADVVIETDSGDIYIKLYDETPGHKANFLKLAKEEFYDGTLFHRVIRGFMIQGGDPWSKDPAKTAQAGGGGPGYTQPAEFNPAFVHKKGAICAARQGDQVNPMRKSSGSQFYIVQGNIVNDNQLNGMEVQIRNDFRRQAMTAWFQQPKNEVYRKMDFNKLKAEDPDSLNRLNTMLMEQFEAEVGSKMVPFKYTPEQRELYKSIGGTPNLDMQYTVFGEVVQGLEVVDKIAAVKTAPGDRPLKDVAMKVRALK